jgi:hypothetical protein
MRLSRSLILTVLTSFLLLGCNAPPNMPNFGKKKGADQKPDPVEPGPVDPSTPVVDPVQQAAGVDKVFAEESAECDAKPASNGRKSLRLLTKAEYANTVRDVLKLTRDPTGSLPAESPLNGFLNNVEINKVSSDHYAGYMDIGIAIADETKSKLQTLAGCTEAAGETCANKVIDTLGAKLFRRPVTAAEKTLLLNTYKKGLALSPREGMTLLIASLLTSPTFLYRSEIGDSAGKLDSYEIASALSYFFWGTSPDDALTALAASGTLATESVMAAEALRLWKDPRSRYVTDQFAHGWLENQSILSTSKDPSLTSTFTPEIQKAMLAEAEDTFDFLIKQSDATFESLYASDFTIGSPALAAYYGGQSMAEGAVNKIKFPGQTRKGLLTLGAIMASHARPDESHPIKRGDFLLQKMLCFVPQPTPKGLVVMVPAKDPTKTTRERFAAHSTSPACSGCHIKMDGIGFGVEDYDTLGRWRSMENGKMVDASGTMVEVDGKDIPFNGGGDLASELAKSSQAKRCFTVHWYRYAHGRSMLASDPDICSTRRIAMKFSKGEISLGQLLIKIITDPSYLKRGE